METIKLNDKQRVSPIRYNSMDTLLNRKEYMIKTLQNYLDRTGNKEEITDTYTSMTENKYILNIVLTKVDYED